MSPERKLIKMNGHYKNTVLFLIKYSPHLISFFSIKEDGDPTPKQGWTGLLYQDLLQSAKFDPERADFKHLRLAYAQSEEYGHHAQDQDIDLRKALADVLNEGDWEAGINIVNRLLELCYLDIEAHMIAASIYRRTGDEKRSTFHLQFAKGLLDSIFQSGDGRSHETAFRVVDVAEEYTVLRVFGVQSICQSLLGVEGHFDIFEVLDPTSGQHAVIYFNIDSAKNGDLEPPSSGAPHKKGERAKFFSLSS